MVKIEINVNKRHLIFLTFLFVSLTGLILVIAQPTTPTNPGHSINDVFGVAPNCLSNPGHPYCSTISSLGWAPQDVAIASGYSATSVNSLALQGQTLNSFCLSNTNGCQNIINSYGRGSIVGGGSDAIPVAGVSCSYWGSASCSGQTLVCPQASTRQFSGSRQATYYGGSGNPEFAFSNTYICVRN